MSHQNDYSQEPKGDGFIPPYGPYQNQQPQGQYAPPHAPNGPYYPGPAPQYPPQDSFRQPFRGEELARVSSITPSEQAELNQPILPPGWYKKPKYIITAIFVVGLTIGLIVISILHDQFNQALQPLVIWLKARSWSWIIPVAILFVLSFPPLFGHEIVGLLVGNVWGLWVGFAIMAGGTLLGEVANYILFKTLCTVRAGKYEQKSLFYAALARAIRNNGFIMALMIRISVIPGHITTMIFSTCGMSFFTYFAAAVLSSPKLFGVVSVGVLFQSEESGAGQDKTTKRISTVLLVLTGVATVVSLRYVRRKVAVEKLWIIRERKGRIGVGQMANA